MINKNERIIIIITILACEAHCVTVPKIGTIISSWQLRNNWPNSLVVDCNLLISILLFVHLETDHSALQHVRTTCSLRKLSASKFSFFVVNNVSDTFNNSIFYIRENEIKNGNVMMKIIRSRKNLLVKKQKKIGRLKLTLITENWEINEYRDNCVIIKFFSRLI